MGKITRIENTDNRILRTIGNVFGSISTYFLVKSLKAEDKNKVKLTIIYSKLFELFEVPQTKWGTYYEYKFDSIVGDNEWTRAKHYKDSIK